MEQFVNDLRDIVLGLLHLIAWLIHAIAWLVHAIAWLIHGIGVLLSHWPWLLAGIGLFLFVVYVVPTIAPLLEGKDIMALFKRKPAEIESGSHAAAASPGVRQRLDAEAAERQRQATDLLWAVRHADVTRINEALALMNPNARLTAEITETNTVTVKKRLVVG